MNTKPILFSTPMVQAILEDRKTQTRRLTNLHKVNKDPDNFYLNGYGVSHICASFSEVITKDRGFEICMNPYGDVGDVLWVRETLR